MSEPWLSAEDMRIIEDDADRFRHAHELYHEAPNFIEGIDVEPDPSCYHCGSYNVSVTGEPDELGCYEVRCCDCGEYSVIGELD